MTQQLRAVSQDRYGTPTMWIDDSNGALFILDMNGRYIQVDQNGNPIIQQQNLYQPQQQQQPRYPQQQQQPQYPPQQTRYPQQQQPQYPPQQQQRGGVGIGGHTPRGYDNMADTGYQQPIGGLNGAPDRNDINSNAGGHTPRGYDVEPPNMYSPPIDKQYAAVTDPIVNNVTKSLENYTAIGVSIMPLYDSITETIDIMVDDTNKTFKFIKDTK